MQPNILKQFPLIKVLIPLIFGIWAGNHVSHTVIPVLAVLTAAFLLWLFFAFRFLKHPRYSRRFLPGIFLFIFVFIFGIAWAGIRSTKVIDSDSDVVFKGYIVSGLGRTSKSCKYKVVSETLKTDSFVTASRLSGMLYLKKDSAVTDLMPGSVILLKGRLLPFRKPLNPYAFDYSQYLIHERISFRIWAKPEDVRLEEGEQITSFSVYIGSLHSSLSKFFERTGINGGNLALLKAVFMGDRSELDPENKRAFADAGVMHLLAVSGLHLGIIYMLLIFLLKPFVSRRAKILRLFIVFLVIWGYAFFTGLTPSVFRAAVMFSMVETGNLLKRSNSVYNQLLASMFIIVLIEPYSIFKAGFWLSHSAVAGIVAFYPMLNNLLTFRFLFFRWIWSLVAVSISAQMATLPLSLFYFHKFPVYFILSNVLMVPVMAPVLLFAFLISVMALFHVSITLIELFAGPLNSMLGYMRDVAEFTGSIPGAVVKYIEFSGLELILTGLLIFSLVLYFNENRRIAVFTFMISFLLLLSVMTVEKIKKYRYSAFVVCAHNRYGVFNRICPEANCLCVTDSLSDIQLDYIAGGFWSEHGAKPPSVNVLKKNKPEISCFSTGDKRILLMHNIFRLPERSIMPDVDYLILSGRRCAGLRTLKRHIMFDEVIISTGLSYWKQHKIAQEAEAMNVSCYNVGEKGAWVCEKY